MRFISTTRNENGRLLDTLVVDEVLLKALILLADVILPKLLVV